MRFFATLLALSNFAWADLPFPRLDRIQPLGGTVGSVVEVECAGAELDDATSLQFDHPGLTSERIEGKDRQFRVKIATDVPEGTYDVRFVGRFGVSNPRVFAVSHGLTDVAEMEPNNSASVAQVLSLDSAVNGSSDGNDQDVFRITAAAGQRIVIDCQAGRLDSSLDANLTLAAADGKPIASSGDYYGRDPLIDFIAPTAGEYLITLNDLSFRGGHPYRLVVTTRPHVENVFPRVVQLGKTATLKVLGRNLGPQSKPSGQGIGEAILDETELSIAAPNDAASLGNFTFLEHPLGHTVQPTAATCTLAGWQVRPQLDRPAVNAINMVVTDYPVSLENEPNDAFDSPQSIELPAVISGRFDRPRDADWYTFESTEAGPIYVDVYCERIAGQADPYVVLKVDADSRVGELDDFGHRIAAFDGHLRDPSGTFNVEAKKKYRLLVQDRYQRGGPRYQYVLSVRRPRPDFFAAAIHSQNPGPGSLNLLPGGAASVDLVVHRVDGHKAPITFTAENLPPGVHAAATTMGDGTAGAFVLWAEANAPQWDGFLRLIGSSRRGEEEIRREVRAYYRVSNDNGIGGSQIARQLAASIRESAPFSVTLQPEKIQSEPGKKVEVKAILERRWPDFKDKLSLLPMTFPGNLKTGTQEIAAGANDITFTIEVDNGAKPGDYTLSMLGQGQVPYAKQADEKNRPNTLVSLPSRPITITVLPAAQPSK